MPPHLRSTSPAGVDWLAFLTPPEHLLKTLLLLFLLVSVTWSLLLLRVRSKRRMAEYNHSPDEKINHVRPVPKKKDSGNSPDIAMGPRFYPQIHANQYLQSLKQEAQQPHLIPIHPWIAPPTPLPGPYDAPYYPLPMPTIRSQHEQSYDDSNSTSMTTSRRESTDSVASNGSETLTTRAYTRRLSDNAKLPYDPVLEGSTTVSSAGWRRTQWSVSAG